MSDQLPPQSFLDKIQATVHMRPKWRFWLDHLAVGTAIVFVAIGLVYIGSFVTFLWRRSHVSALPAFGPEGYGVFVRVFPWWHLLFIIIGVVAFVYLLRRHTHLYRWPLTVTIGVFLFAFVSAAFVTDTTRVHDRLTNRSIDGRSVPFVGSLYRGQARLAQGIVTPGVITKIGKNDVTLDVGNETIKVKITNDTIRDPQWEPKIGDEVVVIGKRNGSTITAEGIHRAEDLPNRRPFRVFQEDWPTPNDAY